MKRWRIPLIVGVAGAAVIGAIYLYNFVSERQIGREYYVPRPMRITPEVVLLQQYVRIRTINPPGNETAGARFLANLLERGGVHAEIIESAPGRGNVYARIRGKRPGEGLMLLNHIDVVPAEGRGWHFPPFAADAALNAVWGRGTLDMKGIAICQIEAFLALARTHRTPERDVVFLGTADEEQGGTMGVAWLLAHRPDVFGGVRYVLNEGGINESFAEQFKYVGVEVGTKMVVKTELRAPSRQVMQQVRIALEPYISPREPDRVLPEVRTFLHDLAPQRVEQRPLLDDIVRTIAEGKFWLVERPYKEVTQNIVAAAEIATDGRGATMEVGLFNLPDEDPDARLAWLRDFVKPYGATVEKVLEKNGPAPLSPRNTRLFALITEEAHRQWPNVPVGTEILATGYNDSRYLRPRGIVCYGLWPFQVDSYQTQG
ncbi:MAG TPA: M20/M25/M40 family metallo-hydrolase, partial [Thermoanaerobaculia bacterium]|nr:M20/M25/M40 family metallo-hydrolase [Thermoanaerobaculia bacterium]